MTNLEKFVEVFGWKPSLNEPLAKWWAEDKYIEPPEKKSGKKAEK